MSLTGSYINFCSKIALGLIFRGYFISQSCHLLVAAQCGTMIWWRAGFHLTGAYFWGRAYIKSILKNHTRTYLRLGLILGKTRYFQCKRFYTITVRNYLHKTELWYNNAAGQSYLYVFHIRWCVYMHFSTWQSIIKGYNIYHLQIFGKRHIFFTGKKIA